MGSVAVDASVTAATDAVGDTRDAAAEAPHARTVDSNRTTVLRLMPLGDSITAGYTDNPKWLVPFNFGYRGRLYTLLQERFAGRFRFVGASMEPWDKIFGDPGMNTTPPSPDLRPLGQDHHRGYEGWGVSQIAANIVSWLKADRPDVVMLMIGINDIPSGSSKTPTAVETGLKSLVQTIVTESPNAQVIVAQITPYDGETPAIVAYNDYIKNVMVPGFIKQGKNVITVNQYAALLGANGAINSSLFAIYVHPNQTGYNRMAQIWFDAVAPLLQ